MHFNEFAEFSRSPFQACDDVDAFLRDGRSLIVQFVQDKLWGKMVTMDEEFICRLAKDAKSVETTFGKVLGVLSNYRVRVSHNRCRQHMPVILIGNAFDGPEEFRWDRDHCFRERLFHLLLSPSYLRRRTVKLGSHGFGHFRQDVFTPYRAVHRRLLGQTQQKIAERHGH